MFIGKKVGKNTEYTSRRTGRKYTIFPDKHGVHVSGFVGLELVPFITRRESLRMIEVVDSNALG